LEFGNSTGKYILSIMRLAAIGALGWYLLKLLKEEVPFGLIACFSLILAGATGNILDGAFYGMIFSHNPGEIAALFPPGGGYSSFLQGKVVDMFYFPMIETRYPAWFPLLGGQEFIFFRHIFNIADAAVFTGVVSIMLFYRSFYGEGKAKENEPAVTDEAANDSIIHAGQA
jgi:signal peptidase II